MRTSIQVDGAGEVLVFRQNRQLLARLQELERTIAEEKTRHRATCIHFDVLQSQGRVCFQKKGPSGGLRLWFPGKDSAWFSDAHLPPFPGRIPALALGLSLGHPFAELVQKSTVDIIQTVFASRHG